MSDEVAERPVRQVRRRTQAKIHTGVTTINVARAEVDTSRQVVYLDDWTGLGTNSGMILEPPYNPVRLYQIIEESNALRPCIDSYVTNVVKPGWEIAPIRREAKINSGERHELESFLEYANSDQDLCAVLDLVIRDRESVGYGFMEVIRDASSSISLLRHASACHTRLGLRHPEEVEVNYQIARGRRVSNVREFRRFRRFVQRVNASTVWFKEFGDPRKMDRDTGLFEGESGYKPGRDATEILHFKLPSNEPYGVPRWVPQLPSILGSREAELVNLRYFQDNTVPPMMLTVSGGRLTKTSYQNLVNTFVENPGKENQHKVAIVEAIGEGDSLDAKGSPVQIKVEKLTDSRQSDALFKDYDAANMAKVRSAWRLAGVLVGMGGDTNYANAQVAIALAEAQVFGPERNDIDEFLNKLLINGYLGLALRSCKIVSRVPPVSSPDSMVKALTALNVMGAVTPRSAITTANTFLQAELPQYPGKGEEGWEEWMDKPIQFSLRSAPENTHNEQAVKDRTIKQQEGEGGLDFRRPENGSEGDAI